MSRGKVIIFPLVSVFLLVEGCGTTKKAAPTDNRIFVDEEVVQPAVVAPPKEALKKISTLSEKYALYLKIPAEKVNNLILYKFIDQWMYTPYLWGGTTKKGIDCSAFVQTLLAEVYKINLPRTSFEQFGEGWIERFASHKALSEGDLVFFRTMEDKIVSHVGLYLANGMFINASSSKGVSIACMDSPYWRKSFVAAGRIKQSIQNSRRIK